MVARRSLNGFSLQLPEGGPGGGQEGFEFSFFFPFSLFPETESHMLFEQMSATLEQKRILRKTHLAFKSLCIVK